jgi:regulator of replication initiation timing
VYDKRKLRKKAWTLRRTQRPKSPPGEKTQHGDFAKLAAAEQSVDPFPTPRSVDTNGHSGYRSHHGEPKRIPRERLHRATKRKMYDSNNWGENAEGERSNEYPSRSTKPNRISSTIGDQQEDEPRRNRRRKMDRFLDAANKSTNGTILDSAGNLELMSVKEERDKLQAECERLKGELEESESKHKAAKVTLMSVEERRDELITIAMQLTGDKNGLQGQTKDLTKERDSALEENENLVAENERLRARLTEVSRLNGMIGDLAIENISSGKQ